MPPEKLTEPGISNIKSIVIIPSDGSARLNVTKSTIELIIYEDLFSPVMTASIQIAETKNVIGKAGISGGETVFIKASAQGAPETLMMNLVFRVRHVTNRMMESHLNVFTLSLISPVGMINNRLRVRKTYNNMLITDIIQDIWNKELGGITKPLSGMMPSSSEVDTTTLSNSPPKPSVGTFSCVIPTWTPLGAIEWLRGKAITSTSMSDKGYVIFQRADGYVLESLDTLMSNFPVAEYMTEKYIPEPITDNPRKYQFKIQGYTIQTPPDAAEQTRAGIYSASEIQHDVIRKTVTKTTFDYHKHFKKESHLNEFPTIENQATPDGDTLFQSFDSRIDLSSSSKNVFPNTPEFFTTSGMARASIASQMAFNRIIVQVPGNPERRVGDVISINIRTTEEVEEGMPPRDRFISGNYLVVALSHLMGPRTYGTTMELSKDSFINEMVGRE